MKKRIIKSNPKYYFWQLFYLAVFGIIALGISFAVWSVLGFSMKIKKLFWFLVIGLFIIAFIFTILLLRKKRTIEITGNYVKFPESNHFKYRFKKGEINKSRLLFLTFGK